MDFNGEELISYSKEDNLSNSINIQHQSSDY